MPEIIREDDTSPIFAKVSVTGGDPADDNDLARKKYVDDNSGGGAAQSPLKGNRKTLPNNTDTGLFTLPLADGEGLFLIINFSEFVKKGGDWGTGGGSFIVSLYNDGGVLQSHFSQFAADNQGTLNLSTYNPSASLTGGVVTLLFTIGNVVSSPDTSYVDFIIINPSGKEITFL